MRGGRDFVVSSHGRALRRAIAVPAVFLAGAAHAAPLFEITTSLSARYDSNVARASDEIAQKRGIKPADWLLSPSINIQLDKALGSQSIYFNGDVGYDLYARNHRLDRERILLDGGARLQFLRCTATADTSLDLHQSDLSELIDSAPAKNTENIRKIALDAQCGGPIGIIPFAGASRTWASNSSSERRFADYVTDQGQGGLAFAGPTFGELAVIAQVRTTDYPDRNGFGLTNHFHVFSIGGRYTRNVGSRLNASISLSRTKVDTAPGFPTFTGLTSNVNVSMVASDNLKLQANWTRSVDPVSLGFGDFAIDSRSSLDADYGLSPLLTLSGGAGSVHRQIEGESFFLVPQIQREQRLFAYARLSYSRSARTNISLELRHERRRANPSSFNYDTTSVGLVVRMKF